MQEELKALEEASRKQAIYEFMDLCPTEEHEAEFYLDEARYDVEAAIRSYLDDPKKALKKLTEEDNHRRIRQIMRSRHSNKQNNHDVLWRPREQGEPARFSLVPPSDSRPGGDHFYETFSSLLPPLNFEKGYFQEAVRKSLVTSKPLLVFGYLNSSITNFRKLLSEENVQLINTEFVFLGVFKNSDDYNRGLKGHIRERNCSSFTLLRVNMFDEIVVMNEYDVQDDRSTAEALNAVLRNAVKSSAEDREEQVKILKQYEHLIDEQRPHEADEEDSMPIEEDGVDVADYESDRLIRQLQEEEFHNSKAEHSRKKSEQLAAEQVERQQLQAMEELIEQRKVRKMSLPCQPQIAQDTITLAFRLPQGGKLCRRFHKSDNLEFVFNYIELSQEVELENEVKRQFDLLTIARESLQNRRQATLEQVFEGSDQETLLVVEL